LKKIAAQLIPVVLNPKFAIGGNLLRPLPPKYSGIEISTIENNCSINLLADKTEIAVITLYLLKAYCSIN